MTCARRMTATLVASLVLSTLAVTWPASSSATKKSAPTTLRAAASQVETGSAVRLRGTTSRAKRLVVLEERIDSRWRRVARTWSSKGRFRFTARVRSGRNTFRAVSTRRSLANRSVLRRTISSPVTVRGVTTTTVSAPTVEAARHTRASFNGRRQALGIPVFAASTCLTRFAAAHSARMMRYDVFEHSSDSFFTSRGHPTYFEVCPATPRSWRGEIITKVRASTAQEAAAEAYASWMSSPPHREIIEWRRGRGFQVGVGFARSANGYWWATAVTAASR